MTKQQNLPAPAPEPEVFRPARPIEEAVAVGDLAEVRRQLKYGVNVHTSNLAGHTLLHLAAIQGHQDMTALLLGAGANLNKRDKEGKTALDRAEQMKNSVAPYLAAIGAKRGEELRK